MPQSSDAPVNLDAAATLKAVASFPFWYHRIQLPHGIETPGWAPMSPEAYRVPTSLAGKRVLDVGSWDGYWAFEALKRGAREVVAIDDFSDYLGILQKDQRKAWDTFDFCRAALGWEPERCRRIEMNVYDVSPENLGKFDVVFCFGVIYHLRHPLYALDKLAAVCTEDIFIESAILDDFSPYRGGIGHGYPNQMVMEFYPDKQYGDNSSNWWVPSLPCLAHMARAAGFDPVTAWKLTPHPQQLPACRGFAHGKRVPPSR